MSYNKNLLIKNINYLRKQQHLKVKELEELLSMSMGYISRLQTGATRMPSIDFLYKVSSYFGISIESLISFDLSDISCTKKFIINFLDRLIIDTEQNKLKWYQRIKCNRLMADIDANHSVLLIKHNTGTITLEMVKSENKENYPDDYEKVCECSNSIKQETDLLLKKLFEVAENSANIIYLNNYVKRVIYNYMGE